MAFSVFSKAPSSVSCTQWLINCSITLKDKAQSNVLAVQVCRHRSDYPKQGRVKFALILQAFSLLNVLLWFALFLLH